MIPCLFGEEQGHHVDCRAGVRPSKERTSVDVTQKSFLGFTLVVYREQTWEIVCKSVTGNVLEPVFVLGLGFCRLEEFPSQYEGGVEIMTDKEFKDFPSIRLIWELDKHRCSTNRFDLAVGDRELECWTRYVSLNLNCKLHGKFHRNEIRSTSSICYGRRFSSVEQDGKMLMEVYWSINNLFPWAYPSKL